MILIRDIDWYETDRDEAEILRCEDPFIHIIHNGERQIEETYLIRELIKGRRFVRRDGTRYIIGLSQKVAEVLKTPMEAWDNATATLDECHARNAQMRSKLHECDLAIDELQVWQIDVVTAPWWRRLLWVFTGVPRA